MFTIELAMLFFIPQILNRIITSAVNVQIKLRIAFLINHISYCKFSLYPGKNPSSGKSSLVQHSSYI